jgi:hypothetical protein
MVVRRCWPVLALLFGVLVACSGESEPDPFVVGRPTIPVYEFGVPDDFDVEQYVTQLAQAFNVTGEIYRPFESLSVGFRNWSGPDASSSRDTDGVGVNMQTWNWGYSVSSEVVVDAFCSNCTPFTMSEEDAIEQSRDVLAKIGLDPDQQVYTTDSKYYPDDSPYAGEIQVLYVDASLRIDGFPSDQVTTLRFGNGAMLFTANGDAGRPIKMADVGLLTPREAFAQKYLGSWDAELTPELEAQFPVDPDSVSLSYASDFNRQKLFEYTIPSYNIPLLPDDALPVDQQALGFVTNVWAIRYQDLPKIP